MTTKWTMLKVTGFFHEMCSMFLSSKFCKCILRCKLNIDLVFDAHIKLCHEH